MENLPKNIAANALRTDLLHLIILPTEKCNLRCTYCYEDFKVGRITPSLMASIESLIISRLPTLKILRIGWFGGEPTTNLAPIIRIGKFILDNKSENLDYRASISTNAVLLSKETALSLINAGVLDYQVTLDGAKDDHNSTRVHADKSGTFEKIWHNLIEMVNLPYDFRVRLRIHVTQKNFVNLHNLINNISEEFYGDERWSLHFKAVEALGAPGDKSFDFLKDESVIDEAEGFAREKGLIVAEREEDICYAAAANSFVIRANGRVAKCTVAFNDKRNDVGKLTQNGLELDMEKLTPWITPVLNQDALGAKCPLWTIGK